MRVIKTNLKKQMRVHQFVIHAYFLKRFPLGHVNSVEGDRNFKDVAFIHSTKFQISIEI